MIFDEQAQHKKMENKNWDQHTNEIFSSPESALHRYLHSLTFNFVGGDVGGSSKG